MGFFHKVKEVLRRGKPLAVNCVRDVLNSGCLDSNGGSTFSAAAQEKSQEQFISSLVRRVLGK